VPDSPAGSSAPRASSGEPRGCSDGEGRGERASIQKITVAADVGFGSFYNHFDSKEELFRTASEEMLERWGQSIDRACAGVDDPLCVKIRRGKI